MRIATVRLTGRWYSTTTCTGRISISHWRCGFVNAFVHILWKDDGTDTNRGIRFGRSQQLSLGRIQVSQELGKKQSHNQRRNPQDVHSCKHVLWNALYITCDERAGTEHTKESEVTAGFHAESSSTMEQKSQQIGAAIFWLIQPGVGTELDWSPTSIGAPSYKEVPQMRKREGE